MINESCIDEMADGYIVAALWADCERMCECESRDMTEDPRLHADDCPFGESGGLTHLDVEEDDRQYVRELCAAFAREADGELIVFAELREFAPHESTVWHHIGHDLRLTSCGHGTGFWDRDPNVDNSPSDAAIIAFYEARAALTTLAGQAPFDRTDGGDIWQVSGDLARIDTWSFDPHAAPGARWNPASEVIS